MRDLQTVLIVIGALIIVAVLVVNWWQERRFHQQVENSFSPLHSDALFDDPKLDVDSLLHDTFDDNATDRFINTTQHYTSGNSLPEDISIDDAYSQLSNTKSKSLPSDDLEHKGNSNSDLNADVNTAQHIDIKAIFDDAFSHTNKADMSYEQAKLETADNTIKLKPGQGVTQNNNENDIQESILSLPAMLHAQMDLTAVLYLAAETSVSTLINSLSGLLEGYDKPVFMHTLDSNKRWVLLNEAPLNQQVSKIACSIQLADRAGAVSRNTLHRFQLAVETIGLDINAHVEWQSTGDALTTAVALDTFCIAVDKTIGFHLMHGENGAFTGTKLRGLAEAQGLMLESDGTFKYFNESSNKQQAQASFIMFNRDDYPFSPEMLRNSVVKGITFQLDIPHVKQCAEAFSQMVQVAKQMEIGLNALLVDDNNKILGDIQIEKIRQQLKVIQATMLVRGIVPGSDSALRLFS